MGKWLAEFKENIPETGISCTDITDRSPKNTLLSVLLVPHQGVLEEKTIEPELMERVSDACVGIDLKPEQFILVLNSQGKDQILSGELSTNTLRDYAKQIDSYIKDGVVNFIMEKIG